VGGDFQGLEAFSNLWKIAVGMIDVANGHALEFFLDCFSLVDVLGSLTGDYRKIAPL